MTTDASPLLTDSVVFGTLGEEVGVVDALRPGQDLFASHEHVVRVAPAPVLRVGHRVEGPHRQRILVHDEVVCVVLRRRRSGHTQRHHTTRRRNEHTGYNEHKANKQRRFPGDETPKPTTAKATSSQLQTLECHSMHVSHGTQRNLNSQRRVSTAPAVTAASDGPAAGRGRYCPAARRREGDRRGCSGRPSLVRSAARQTTAGYSRR